MKRGAILLIICMMIIPVHHVYGVESEPSDWAKQDVEYMIAHRLVPESIRGQYSANITRAEYAELIFRILEERIGRTRLQTVINEHRFADATDSSIYTIHAFGIVNGINEQSFQPDKFIDRKEAVVMMGNLLQTLNLGEVTTDAAPYVDYSAIPVWAQDAANITYAAGIFTGSRAGMEPDKSYTREQAIVTMKRLLDYVQEPTGISYRGKVYVELESMVSTYVGYQYIKIGSDKDPHTVLDLWSTIADNFPGVHLDGSMSESIESAGFLIDTLGDDYKIRISW